MSADAYSVSRALVFTSHLHAMGGVSRAAAALARGLARLMPTSIASPVPVQPQVHDWLAGLNVVPYEPGMEADYALLLNVDVFSYAQPLAQRNLAFIFFPRKHEPAPEAFELLANSRYTACHVEAWWQRPCQPLYQAVDNDFQPGPKRNVVLHVSRFSGQAGGESNKGHMCMIEAFKRLQEHAPGWELVMIGALDPEDGLFLDALLQRAYGGNIRIMANLDQRRLQAWFACAAIYWHATGMARPNQPEAQEHFGLSTIEAMCAGAVPIVNKSGGPCEMVIDRYNGLFFESPDELVRHTLDLMASPSGWSLLSQRAVMSGQVWQDQDAFTARLQAVIEQRPCPAPSYRSWLTGGPGPDRVCAIIPVNHDADYVRCCLNRLHEHAPAVKVILVALVAPTADLCEVVERRGGVCLSCEARHETAACMAALPHCDRPLVLVLDPKIVLGADQDLDFLLAEMADPDVGVVGPKLLLPDGRIWFGGMRCDADDERLFIPAGYGHPDAVCHSRREETFAVSSVCLLCRRELFALDPELPMFHGAIDLCLQARLQGRKVFYQPAAVMVYDETDDAREDPAYADRMAAGRRRMLEKYPDLTGQELFHA